ncbi:MAG: hypothetical protein HYS88_01855 [Candidatus Colwellbacteria bacterium]|nr:hypothetical protein [Candidatus Colwellbacteria bacterium]
MIRVSEEEFMERFKAVPQVLRDFTVSVEVGDMLWRIGEVHHLQDERIGKIAAILSYIVLGLIHLEDLAKEITAETAIDRRLAEELAREIHVKILALAIPEIQKFYHYGSVGSPQAASGSSQGAEITAGQPQQIRPTFAPPGAGEQPFILHEEQKEIEPVRPMEESLVRPSFYEETSDKRQETGAEGPAAARLEIGGVGEVHPPAGGKEPQIGKTETPPVRVVHYSGPQTPVDPFGSQVPDSGQGDISQAPEKLSKQSLLPPRDIHPENVVDLKDLPK